MRMSLVAVSFAVLMQACVGDGDEAYPDVGTVTAALVDPPWVQSTKALNELRAVHRSQLATTLASLPGTEKARRLDHLLWRGIAPGELEVQRNAFGAVASITGPFLRLPHTDQTPKTKAGEAALAFMSRWGRRLFAAQSTDSLVLDTTSPALVHGLPGSVVFQQKRSGVSVIGATAQIFLDRQLKVFAAYGSIVPGFSVNMTPSVPQATATGIAIQATETETGEDCSGAGTTLGGWNTAFAQGVDQDALVWRVSVSCTNSQGRLVLVDAHNSTIRFMYDPIRYYDVRDRFVRFVGETDEECFGPELDPDLCKLADDAARVVVDDGDCDWSYDIVGGMPVAPGRPQDAQHPANCNQVAETDQVIRSLEEVENFILDQPWLNQEDNEPYAVADLGSLACGFCVDINVGSDKFDAISGMEGGTIGFAGIDGWLHLRPGVGGPDIVGHEALHAMSARLGSEANGTLEEHIADVVGAIVTNRALENEYGVAYESPDPWTDGGTQEQAAVEAQHDVRSKYRPCSLMEHPDDDRIADPENNLETLLSSEELDAGDPRRPEPNWRSLASPWWNNRGHCAGVESYNGEWQSDREAYSRYFAHSKDDADINPWGYALTHTNLGIGNRMLELFTEGGNRRGFSVGGWGFQELERTVFGGLLLAPRARPEHAGRQWGWSKWAGALVDSACLLGQEVGGQGCDGFELNARADAVLDSAASASIWSNPYELTGTDAAVAHPLAAVSYEAAGGNERIYVFYRGSESLTGNAAIHYRWFDASATRYLGVAPADGSWHPVNGDCTIPDSASATGPTAIARGDSVWVAWVEETVGGSLVRGRSFADLPENADGCIAAEAWSTRSPAVQNAQLFPAFFDGALDVDGPVSLVEIPVTPPDNPLARFVRCVNQAAPWAVQPFPGRAIDPPGANAWVCMEYPQERPLLPEELVEIGNLIDDGINPDELRVTVPFGTDGEAPGRDDPAIGDRARVNPAPYAEMSYAYRTALTSGPLLGADFADAFDGSGLTQGAARGAAIEVVQELLPDDGGERLSNLEEVQLSFPLSHVMLVWKDASGQVWIHPWDLVGVSPNQVQPAPVMQSSVAPAVVGHRYRRALFDERWGVYVFGTDADGAVTVARSSNDSGTLEGIMTFGEPEVLAEMPDPEIDPVNPLQEPRPPLYRAWTDRPVAVWSRPARAQRDGALHFVLSSPFDPTVGAMDTRLGFRFDNGNDFNQYSGVRYSTFLAAVVDTASATGAIVLRPGERLFSMPGTWATGDHAEYLPASGAGIVSERDVVYYLHAAAYNREADYRVDQIVVRAKMGE